MVNKFAGVMACVGIAFMAPACGFSSAPSRACADAVVAATTDTFHVKPGVSRCLIIPGLSVSDGDFLLFANQPPIFQKVVQRCLYDRQKKEYVYGVRSSDGTTGAIVVDVRPDGKATNVTKVRFKYKTTHAC